MIFTQEQIDVFNEQGFAILSNLLDSNEVDYLRNFFHDLFVSGYWKKSPYNSNTIINDLYTDFPELVDIVFKEKYILAAKELLGPEMVCVPECSIHYNRYFDWHRDTAIMEANGLSTHTIPTNRLIQGGLYLQDNSYDGGGLILIPGSNFGEDKFKKHYYGSRYNKVINGFQKILGISLGQKIERSSKLVLPATKAGDVLFFDSYLDHRASFSRTIFGKAKIPKKEKFAIFNGFCSNRRMAKDYLQSIIRPDEPYANFLKQATTPPKLVQKTRELKFEIEYPS